MRTSAYNNVLPLGSFDDLVARMNRDVYADDGIINYMQNHFIPLEVFAKVLALYSGNNKVQAISWDSFYHSCITEYFRTSGTMAMSQFIANGCKPEDAKNIYLLLEKHPARNSLVTALSKGTGEDFLSPREKLLYDALVKAKALLKKYEDEKKTDVSTLTKSGKDAYEIAIVNELLRILDDPKQPVSVESELIGHRPRILKYSAYLDEKKLFSLYETGKLEVYSDNESPLIIENRTLLLPLEAKVGDLLILQIDAQTEKQNETLNWLRGIGSQHN